MEWPDSLDYLAGFKNIVPRKLEVSWNGFPIWGYLPYALQEGPIANSREDNCASRLPVYIFMHGATGEWDMYEQNLKLISSHGFIVLFPFVKSPSADKRFWTTDTQGQCISRAIEFLEACVAGNTSDEVSEELRCRADLSNVVVAGHSMGANGAIMATSRWIGTLLTQDAAEENGAVIKALIAHHPGIIGPWGPPPWPFCYTTDILADILRAGVPMLMITAANDVAFRGKKTAACQYEGFKGALELVVGQAKHAVFIEFSESVCQEDGMRKPRFDDGGHNCPLKLPENNPETPWVLRFAKLFAQLAGASSTECFQSVFVDRHENVTKFDLIDGEGQRHVSS